MKKFLIIAFLSIFAWNANAQFFAGANFGVNVGSEERESGEAHENGSKSVGTSFTPRIGYRFNDKFMAGIKINYSYNTNDTTPYRVGESDSSSGILSALSLITGGSSTEGTDKKTHSWAIKPFVRYRMMRMLNDKVEVFAELNGKFGGTLVLKNGAKSNHNINYGVTLHPVVSYQLSKNSCIETSLDLLSIGWSGTTAFHDEYKEMSWQFLFSSQPLLAIANGLLNIGFVRYF